MTLAVITYDRHITGVKNSLTRTSMLVGTDGGLLHMLQRFVELEGACKIPAAPFSAPAPTAVAKPWVKARKKKSAPVSVVPADATAPVAASFALLKDLKDELISLADTCYNDVNCAVRLLGQLRLGRVKLQAMSDSFQALLPALHQRH